MDKKEIAAFFDRCAEHWDADMVRNEDVIGMILDNAGITEGVDVLDVATGTGVLIPDYLKRGVRSVTAVDISPEMARIAAAKFKQNNVTVLCADAETADFGRKFDRIMIYNAFPHFPEPEKIIAALSALLNKGGVLSVAHGMSREKLERHHAGSARNVSRELLSEEELGAIFSKYLTVTVKISDERMYQVVGVK